MNILKRIIIFLFVITSSAYGAGDVLLTGSMVKLNPSLVGGEFTGTYLFRPVVDRAAWLVGPRAGLVWAGGDQSNRFDSIVGVEGVVWFVNAIGVGSSFDGLISDHPFHFRINPYLAVRVLRFRNDGAWAIRVGIPYDTRYQWGAQVGMSLQLGGVPNIGGLDD